MASTEVETRRGPIDKWLPIVRDVRAQGLVPAVAAKTNEIVTRITTGMDIADVRSVLRGDPPPRPNPRLKPHADAFLFHIRPSYYHQAVTGLYPSFKMGWLAFPSWWKRSRALPDDLLHALAHLAYGHAQPAGARAPGQLMRDLHRISSDHGRGGRAAHAAHLPDRSYRNRASSPGPRA
jgi:hypothetical protein